MTPVTSYYTDEQFRQKAQRVLDRWDVNRASPHAAERLDQDALELAVHGVGGAIGCVVERLVDA